MAQSSRSPLDKPLTDEGKRLSEWIASGVFKPSCQGCRPGRDGHDWHQFAKDIEPIAQAMLQHCTLRMNADESDILAPNRPKRHDRITGQLVLLLPWEVLRIQAGDAPRLDVIMPHVPILPNFLFTQLVVGIEPSGMVQAWHASTGHRDELLAMNLGLGNTLKAHSIDQVPFVKGKSGLPFNPREFGKLLKHLPAYLAAVA